MNTGVIGGEPGRIQSLAARTSEKTSSSQPSLTTGKAAKPGLGAMIALTGVGRISEGGLLAELKLPAADSVGVAGKYPRQSVSNGISMSWCRRSDGLWCRARGDAAGVSIA